MNKRSSLLLTILVPAFLLADSSQAYATETTTIDLYCQYHRTDAMGRKTTGRSDPSFTIRIAPDGTTEITSSSRWLACTEWRGQSDLSNIQGTCRKTNHSGAHEDQLEISRVTGRLRHNFLLDRKNELAEFSGYGICQQAEAKF